MPVRVVHARAVLAANAMMARAVRTMTAPAGLAIRVLAARLTMDPLALRIQDRAGRATEALAALVIQGRAERGKTVRPFAGDSSRPQCAACRTLDSVPDRSKREDLAKIINHWSPIFARSYTRAWFAL